MTRPTTCASEGESQDMYFARLAQNWVDGGWGEEDARRHLAVVLSSAPPITLRSRDRNALAFLLVKTAPTTASDVANPSEPREYRRVAICAGRYEGLSGEVIDEREGQETARVRLTSEIDYSKSWLATTQTPSAGGDRGE